MSETDAKLLAIQKDSLRRRGYAARKAQQDKDMLSRKTCNTLIKLPEYQDSDTVLWYLDQRSELRTQHAIPAALASSKKVTIPYCVGNELHLWWLHGLDELASGSYGILEPPAHRWNDHDRAVDVKQLDLVIVPGVGFDRQGHRLGNGQGYYDRLLSKAGPNTLFIALCYESQIFNEIPATPTDVNMHMIITEKQIYTHDGGICKKVLHIP
ncbi:MAG: 5-formyltetrahydrofolate cyclo-ligase [Gammaproteobacteria bacterium]|nr:5-formyltetrahydrofolate cyclo-ligase [Gammaproteobacteria bacterium]